MGEQERGTTAPRLFPIFAGDSDGIPRSSAKYRKQKEQVKTAGNQQAVHSTISSNCEKNVSVQRAVRGTGGEAHPFFAKRQGTNWEETTKTYIDREPVRCQSNAPYPSMETMHIAPECSVPRTQLILPTSWSWRKDKVSGSNNTCDDTFPAFMLSAHAESQDIGRDNDKSLPIACEAALTEEWQVPESCKPLEYIHGDLAKGMQGMGPIPPALQSIYQQLQHAPAQSLTESHPDPASSLWTDRWRPKKAHEVLCNEQAAGYVRDWLHDLRVTFQSNASRKRPVLTRVTQRKRGRTRQNGTKDDDEWNSEEEAWFDQYRTSATSKLPLLTNCLLLQGPTGSGKSAVVYACAQELGFEVFELYVGIGRRSGKELVNAVGQLARNHMVAQETSNEPRQSLILLDEADILFDEDAGFWAAVVELVKESHRPVILTCTDPSRIPVSDLPIQRVITLKSPPLSVGATYLQLLALAEGYIVSQASMRALYSQTLATPPEIPGSGPLHPRSDLYPLGRFDLNSAAFDLRAALMQLQWVCLYTRARSIGEAQRAGADIADKKSEKNAMPLHSMPQSCPKNPEKLIKHVRGPPALQLLDRLRNLADIGSVCELHDSVEVMEPTTIPLPPWSRASVDIAPSKYGFSMSNEWIAMHIGSALCCAMQTIAMSDWKTACEQWPCLGMEGCSSFSPLLSTNSTDLDAQRLIHCRYLEQLVSLLNISISDQLPNQSIPIDYAPYIRQMMNIDHVCQIAAHAHSQQMGTTRSTRNSTHVLYTPYGWRVQSHQPWIALGPAERSAYQATSFPSL
ncbi:hypothetical protein MYAM1_002470 [Malassezia yamatoensis]|uniref:AAA+ ATPase domain-containing protein n=1 Tax=Malassezia yamatoensis TaxID=253288 RepID=A0AAJ5YUN7_9BASI|nr:hypothetical protein MYAM1_002470 [Malassezia yamatoensis]